jgi:hypothetical protein
MVSGCKHERLDLRLDKIDYLVHGLNFKQQQKKYVISHPICSVFLLKLSWIIIIVSRNPTVVYIVVDPYVFASRIRIRQ